MVNVTKPWLPPLADLIPHLQKIWESGWVSNSGPYHQELEGRLSEFLGVEHVSLFCNATIALMVAQRVLDIQGEVITTPFSFVATSHAISWAGNVPVFVDIDPDSLCIDPDAIERAITESTSAIMPLHCFGNVAAVNTIDAIAEKHNLKVLYDGCHSFGSEDDGGSVLRHGDAAVVSFHATKVFNTLEGGLLVSNDLNTKQKVDRLRNFGFLNETTVTEIGLNGKMQEVSAAIGVLQLDYLQDAIKLRGQIDSLYRALLGELDGISCVRPVGQKEKNYSYFPVLLTESSRVSRDTLYERLKANGINGRRYFFPLISEFPMYRNLPSATHANLAKARAISERIICLPIYPELPLDSVRKTAEIISEAVS